MSAAVLLHSLGNRMLRTHGSSMTVKVIVDIPPQQELSHRCIENRSSQHVDVLQISNTIQTKLLLQHHTVVGGAAAPHHKVVATMTRDHETSLCNMCVHKAVV